jgi:hypothetical protein
MRMLRTPLRILALLALCASCGEARFDAQAEFERWFERVELEGRSDAPEVLIVWDGMGPARSQLVDSVQFALWSDGQAIWRDGDLLEASSHRQFRCTADELRDLRAAFAGELADQFRWGPQTACGGSQLILWRERNSIQGVLCDAFLESLDLDGSPFGRVTTPVPPRSDWERDSGWARLSDSDRAAVRARLSLEEAVTKLVARHPEARATTDLRLAVQ